MTQLTTEQIEAENEEIRKIEEEEAIEDLNELKQDMIERHADFLTPHDVSKIFLRRVKKDKDAVIALTGDEGEGKSTLALHIIQETLRLHHKTEEEILETINDYVIYSPNKEEVKKRIIGLPKYMPVSADEAIKILYKLNWGTEIQKYLNMLYAICRKENKITILCMPRFIDFNEFFRNHRIKFWIHILERGRAVMFSKDWSPFSKDPWWLDENQKIINSSYKRGKRLVDFNNEEKIRLLSKLKIYVSELHFDDMPPEIEKRYREGKEAGGYTDMEEQMSSQKAGKKDDVWKGRVMASINLLAEAGISREKVLTELGMSNDDLRTTMHDVRAINPNVIVRYPSITKKVTPSKTNILEKQE